MVHITCGNKTPKIPQSGCSDCEQLEERVEALEQCCEDVHIALDDKADETEIAEIMHIINGLAAGWHYIGDIEGVENLPDSVSAGEAFYDTTTGSWYIAKEDVPSGATITDFLFVSGNDYTLHTGTVDGDAVIRLTDTHGANSDIPIIGGGAVRVEDGEDLLVIEVDNATTEQAGLMSPEDKDKLDNIDDIYDETCGDPAEFEGQGGANLKSVRVALEPKQDGTPWQDSTLYKTPYLFQAIPNINHSINRENLDKIVGGTVAFNQQMPAFNSTTKTVNGITFTFDNDTGKVTVAGTATERAQSNQTKVIDVVAGHKYYLSGMEHVSFHDGTWALISGTSRGAITTVASTGQLAMTVEVLGDNNIGVPINGSFYPMVIDLTQMFGSTIADYIYSLETATAGAGVAWFKKLFPKDYYPYNAGELMSVQAVSHDMVGFNAWDEEWEVGSISNTTGNNTSNAQAIRSKNYIPVIGGATYFFRCDASMNTYNIQSRFYDADKNYLGTGGTWYCNTAFTIPTNARYMRFGMQNQYGTTYKNDICINLSWDGERDGEYEAYVKHSYPLDSDLELRGIPKLDSANNLYYDGDAYESDGSVTRKYGVVDLGTLTWIKNDNWNGSPGFYIDTKLPNSYISTSGADSTKVDMLCSRYEVKSRDYLYVHYDENGICLPNGGLISVRDSAYANYTAAQFKTAMSGVYLVYKLATPTTEEADSYQNPQIVDDFGTEEFVDTRAVAIPVGNNTRYADVYEITGTDEVTVTVADDPDNPTTSDDYTTDLTQTVYEGTVDVVSGKAVLTMGSIESYNGETINEPWLSSLDPYVAGTTPTTGAHVVYTLDTPIEIDLTPNEIEALLGDNYVWSEQGRVCVTFMRDRGELSETLAELQECCDSCDSSECESDLVVFQHISADAYNRYPLDSLLPGDDVLYKITVNGVSKIIESAIYGDAWMWAYRGDSELFFIYDEGWSVTTDAGEYDIKIETVCNQPLYVNLSTSPLESTGEIVMDKTFTEIEDAYKLGKTVIVRYSNYQHYTPLQVCYDPYTGFFVSIHGYDKITSTFDIFTFLAVLDNDYPTYSGVA